MKQKMIFLALLLMALSTARVHSQVNIGSEQEPRGGAVLDLSQVPDQRLGLLLPRVSLANVTSWQLRGDDADKTWGFGMLVYNTNEQIVGGKGVGVYMWNGEHWEPLKEGERELVTSFEVSPSSSTVNVLLGGSTLFTVSDIVPGNATYPGVTWAITSGTDKISLTNKKLDSCTVSGLALGSATLAVKSLDENVRKTISINVRNCVSAPAPPIGITFTKTDIAVNEEIEATAIPAPGAPVTLYTWTVPEELFELVIGQGDHTVILKAKAQATITDAIKVKAGNACGTSADYANTTPVTICSGPPASTGAISGLTSVNPIAGLTYSVAPISGAGSYTWTLPTGWTITNGQGTSKITVTAGTMDGTITVTPNNVCGQGPQQALDVTVDSPGLIILGGEYESAVADQYLNIPIGTTFAALTNINGSWKFRKTGKDLIWSKKNGLSNSTNWESAKYGCAGNSAAFHDGKSGWRLPNIAELGSIQDIFSTLGSQPGAPTGTDNLLHNYYWSSTESSGDGAVLWHFVGGYAEPSDKLGSNYVRCVKSN